ncbi:substrate-binding domain-containing protein [Nocardioides carbamazepini]|uniref:sugar ABC transporter substrate-binding protein n=1 Tax=Nocardioides carbamazepini TaxID=2854259 RepID=UPI002149F7FA|nr:substrate-binding domain-containing protein [Nocardioides carbamazepini]MCR1783668.1 substrate-binding domain-containing protein [Nocardioides carbamazepini]
MKNHNLLRTVALPLIAVAALALSACSDTAEGGSTKDELAANTDGLDELFEGTEHEPPTTGPEMSTDKSVWWISCGMAIPDCSVPANAAQEAALAMGIEFHIADGKLNVGGGNEAAVRTALAAKPDALIIHGISCPIVQAPLQEAVDAGVEVMGVEALDCAATGGPQLFTAEMNYAEGAETGEEYFKRWGEIGADYLVAATEGKAKVIVNEGTEPLQALINDAFVATVEECEECEILEQIEFGSADLAPEGTWIQQFRASLAQHPDANSVFLPFDVNISTAGGAQAVNESGLDLIGAGGSGQAPALDLVRDDKFTAVTAAHSATWMGYAAMDNINRVLQGEDTVPQGVGFRVVDANNNLPESPESQYETPIDFVAAYNELWASAS